MINTILVGLCALFLAPNLCLVMPASEAGGLTGDLLDFEVSAECNPHDDIGGPTNMKVRFAHMSTAAAVESEAFLSIENGPEVAALETRWDYPDKNYFASIFPGAPVTFHRYCQPSLAAVDLHMSYYKQEGIRLFLNDTEQITKREMDAINGSISNTINMTAADGEINTFRAGPETTNPYWIQFAVPVHSLHNMNTTVRYQLR